MAILEPYFLAARERFLEHGFERVKRTRLACSSALHDTARHFAATRDDGLEVILTPEMVEIGEDFVVGIVAHELGHATDFLYPGEFVLGRSGEEIVRRRREDTSELQWARWLTEWQKRDAYVVEKTADLIAGLVWGMPIGYQGPCMLETFEGGVPRPRELR